MSKDNIAVTVSEVSKSFKLPHEKQTSVKGMFVNLFRGRKTYEQQTVLKDLSFEIKKGEFFGIVGRNGSGKSTLLKLLAGIYSPDGGAITLNGKLTPFIELGVGFNPELTGRENIYLNGALLGFNTKEMDAMYDEIVAFAELEKFMDQKLRNYSSGMQVRLAFSIAIKARREILIFDEVLAVGDEAFQRKCLDVFEKYKAEKQTVILVTHEMETVRKFCTSAMLLDKGEIASFGNPRVVAEKYSKLNQEEIDRGVATGNSEIEQTALLAYITDVNGKKRQSFELGHSMKVHVEWPKLDVRNLESVGINIFKLSGEHVTGINTRYGLTGNAWKRNSRVAAEFTLNIAPGKYFILVQAYDTKGNVLDSIFHGPEFSVVAKGIQWSGLIDLPHKWE